VITNLYSVFDTKASIFGIPFGDMTDSSALRNFSDAVKDGSNPNNLWHKHPEDFSLYAIGYFDGDTGEVVPNRPKNLMTASALMTSADLDIRDKNQNGKQLDLDLK
jgi:hypothetical protein